MYGYIRPVKVQLKDSDYESFQQLYCGLCHALKEQGGFFARFVVNYDFAFLAMLLSHADKPLCQMQHCPAHMGRKRACVVDDEALASAADESLILAWWKLDDGIRDSRFFKAAYYRFLRVLLRPAFQKASAARQDFSDFVSEKLQALHRLEDTQQGSLDQAADSFALILQAAAMPEKDEARRRACAQLLYHLGRTIYILDAIDDLSDDQAHHTYNPLIYRFSLQDKPLSEEHKQQLRTTLIYSQHEISVAYELLESNAFSAVLSNTIFFGIPWAIESVLSGQWKKLCRIHLKQEKL